MVGAGLLPQTGPGNGRNAMHHPEEIMTDGTKGNLAAFLAGIITAAAFELLDLVLVMICGA